jgi:2-methylisocitrate lyase-like PEP mutase family enzyme
MSTKNTPHSFRSLLQRPGIIPTLGIHDAFTALIAEQAGIETLFLGGFGNSASMLGLPDLNLITQTEMADATRRIAACLTIPLIADGDTGHGDLHQVQRTVELFESAGAAGILLEDQVAPKRCGHFDNKQVIPTGEMILKIKAAVAARTNPDFAIFARTDARQMNGLADAIDRVNRCCDVGADVAFVEAPQSVDELEKVAREVDHPLFANMLSGGATPILTVSELGQIGYKIAVAPIESLLVCASAIRKLCDTWKTEGRVDHLIKDAIGFGEMKKLLGVEQFLNLRDELDA